MRILYEGKRVKNVRVTKINIFFYLTSFEDTSDLQHRDEVEDEGSHNDGGRSLLEMDIAKYFGISD